MSKSKFVNVIGSETEQDVWDNHKLVVRADVIKQFSVHESSYGHICGGRFWRFNAECDYPDIQEKAESATDVCRDGADLADHELSGTVFQAVMAMLADLAKERTLGKTRIMRLNTSESAASAGGNHVNVSMPVGLNRRRGSETNRYKADFGHVVKLLRPFFSTLQLFTGTGVVIPLKDAATRIRGANYGYAISPRAYHVVKDSGPAYTKYASGNKPLFLYRDEPHADRDKSWRLQMCCLDSGILYDMMRFKYDLILLLAEMVSTGRLKRLIVNNPRGRHLASAISLDWRISLRTSAGVMTPLQIQRWYLRQARSYVFRYRNGVGHELLNEWSNLLDEFDTDEDVPTSLFGRVDWITKILLIRGVERKLDEQVPGSVPSYRHVENIHFDYHAFWIEPPNDDPFANPPRLCTPLKLIKRFGPPDVLGRIYRATDVPPEGTRAELRGALLASGKVAKVDWEYVEPENGVRINLPDPAACTTPQSEEYLRTLSQLREKEAA